MVKGFATALKRVGHVGDVQLRVLLEMLGQILSGCLQSTAGLSRQNNQVKRSDCSIKHDVRSLFDDHVGVCAADAKRTNACPARRAVDGPLGKFRVHIERTVLKIYRRVWLLKMKDRRNLSVFECEDCLDYPRATGRRIRVPDAGFYRANRTELFRL